MKGPGSSLSLVCEYLSHGNLANHLRSFAKMGRFTPHKTVVKLAADTAAGMYHLHCEGILHRGAFVVGEPCERGERVRVSDHDLRGSLACAFVWKQISQRGICWYVQALMCKSTSVARRALTTLPLVLDHRSSTIPTVPSRWRSRTLDCHAKAAPTCRALVSAPSNGWYEIRVARAGRRATITTHSRTRLLTLLCCSRQSS